MGYNKRLYICYTKALDIGLFLHVGYPKNSEVKLLASTTIKKPRNVSVKEYKLTDPFTVIRVSDGRDVFKVTNPDKIAEITNLLLLT